jgi:hypothetical protein
MSRDTFIIISGGRLFGDTFVRWSSVDAVEDGIDRADGEPYCLIFVGGRAHCHNGQSAAEFLADVNALLMTRDDPEPVKVGKR